MRSAGQIPLSRALDNARKEAAVRYSGTAANSATETISPLIFHPAFPIQPPPLRGTSCHRKEGVHLSTKIGHETKKIRHKN